MFYRRAPAPRHEKKKGEGGENNRPNDEGEGCHFEQLLHDEAKMAEKQTDDDVVRPRMNAL